jgi:glycogen synthase
VSLRVLMTADTAGGVWVHALGLCQALAPAGVRFRLVALGEPSPAQRAAARMATNVELVAFPTRLEWMQDPWEDLARVESCLLRQADIGGCNLVHLNHLVHGHLDWQRPVVCAVHSCVSSWFEAVRGERAPSSWDGYRDRVARSLRAADRVVAPSRWMLERAEQFYGPFRAGSVIVNGSAAPAATPLGGRAGMLGVRAGMLGVRAGIFGVRAGIFGVRAGIFGVRAGIFGVRAGILAAGRVWDDAKNLQALADLAERLPAPLRIAGPLRAPDGRQVQAGGVALGDLDQRQLWAAMRRTRVFAAPASYEPFGLGILEAARSGCALVLGDIPSLRELWDGAARFVDPRRPAQWLPVLEQLLTDDAHWLRWAEAAQQRAAGFTLARMARAYLALYRQVLNGTPSTSKPATRHPSMGLS